jgi:hypothetical protein
VLCLAHRLVLALPPTPAPSPRLNLDAVKAEMHQISAGS